MTCNLGTNERAIRFAVGVSLFVAASLLELSDWIRGALYVVGGVALLTGFFGFCPAWKLFGINTRATKISEQR